MAACSSAPPEEPLVAVTSGIRAGAPSDDPRVVALLGDAACSGVLVAPRFVLTAAHCVDPRPAAVRFAGAGGTVAVQRTHRHPAYDAATLSHDVAVVELVHETSAVPAPLPPMTDGSLELRGSRVRVAGFGRPAADGNGGTLRDGTAIVAAVAEQTFELRASPSLPCAGDSGGPVFAGEIVVGVTSFGDATCTDVAVATRVDAYRSFVDEAMREAEAGGGPEPGCTASPSGDRRGALALVVVLLTAFGRRARVSIRKHQIGRHSILSRRRGSQNRD